MYKLHSQDEDSIKMVQFMFGNLSKDITKGYIGAIDEKIDKYTQDHSNYLVVKIDGKSFNINNLLVIVLTTSELRKVLQKVYLSEKDNTNEEK